MKRQAVIDAVFSAHDAESTRRAAELFRRWMDAHPSDAQLAMLGKWVARKRDLYGVRPVKRSRV